MANDGEAVVSALAELLCRRCVERPPMEDGDVARRIILTAADVLPPALYAAAVGGVWAGYLQTDSLEPTTVAAAHEAARQVVRSGASDAERALATAALALMAVREIGDQPVVDLVEAARSFQSVEQHEAALWAADQALGRSEELAPSHRAMALLIAAVVSREPDRITNAYEAAAGLPPDDVAARAATALRPTLHPEGGWELAGIRKAVADLSRTAAARSIANQLSTLRIRTDDDMLRGVHQAAIAISTEDIDDRAARVGLTVALGHYRRRRRLGQAPPAALAALDLIADTLSLGNVTSSAAVLLTQLVEALADAGLSELTDLSQVNDVPDLVQARLANLAQREPIWPELQECIAGLRGRHALLMRRQRIQPTGDALTILGLYIAPPSSIAIKKTQMTAADNDLLSRLASGHPANLAAVKITAVQDLVGRLLPASLAANAVAGALPSLLIVPDGSLWSVPWQLASPLVNTIVTTAPSLSVHARLAATADPIQNVIAVIDDDAPGAQMVYEALHEARAGGELDVRFTSRIVPGVETDLLLMFGHGTGAGLRFRTGTSGQPLEVLDLTNVNARHALIATCWSAAAPPTSFPLNLPAALQLSGIPTVIGGLWPLPARSTAAIVSRAVKLIAARNAFLPAIAAARSASPNTVGDRWGLAAHGTVPLVQ